MKRKVIKILIILALFLFFIFDIFSIIGNYISLKFLIEDNISSTALETINAMYNFVNEFTFFSIINILIISSVGIYILFQSNKNTNKGKNKSIIIFVYVYIILQIIIIFYNYYRLKSNIKWNMTKINVIESINDITIRCFTFFIFHLMIFCLMTVFINKKSKKQT